MNLTNDAFSQLLLNNGRTTGLTARPRFVPMHAFVPIAVHTIDVSITYLCVPVVFTDNTKCQFAIMWYGFVT